MDNNVKLGLTAVGALVIGGLTVSLVGEGGKDSDNVPTTLETVPVGVVKDPNSAPVEPTPEPVGPLTTDLDSETAEPGQRVVTGVNLREGWVPSSEFTLTGDAVGCFKVIASQMVGTFLKVMVENTCDHPLKFTATFQYNKAN